MIDNHHWKEVSYDCFVLSGDIYYKTFKTFKELYDFCKANNINARQV